jgi:hypothetical protein
MADLVSDMVSGDLAGAEDRWLVAARNEAVELIWLRNAALDALGSDLALTPNLERYRNADMSVHRKTLTSFASTSITRVERMLPATSIAKHSRVYSSITRARERRSCSC